MKCSVFYNSDGLNGFMYNGIAYYFNSKGVFFKEKINDCFEKLKGSISDLLVKSCTIGSISQLEEYSNMNIKDYYYIEKLTGKKFKDLFEEC